MKKLAIEGHKTRGNEVIELLEMLGGKNIQRLNGALSKCYYIIDNQSISVCLLVEDDYVVYTLEEFKDKFPYKVGDEVIAYAEGCLAHFTIQDIRWNNKLNKIEYKICSSWYDTSLMQPYKEETIDDFKANTKEIDDKIYTNISQLKVVNDIDMGKNIFGYKPNEHNSIDRNVNDICDDILINQITAKVAIINLKSDVCDDEVELNLGDYEIEIRDNKTYAVLKKPKYPKTYEECCKILKIPTDGGIALVGKWCMEDDYIPQHLEILRAFSKLLICRNAYWKIAGEQMRLGKSWNPDFTNNDEVRYGIYTAKNKVEREFCGVGDVNTVLTFPTEEIRDTFYENIKDLIEQCKELL